MVEVMEIYSFLSANLGQFAEALLALIFAAEVIVRLTPTTSDDGAVERVGGMVRQALNFLRIPNRTK